MSEAEPPQMIEVEYYRLWGGDSGTWDVDVIQIPAWSEDKDAAVRKAAQAIEWRSESPVIVGYYAGPHEDVDEEPE